MGIVLLAPGGAWFTGVALKVIVLGVGSRFTPPLAVPPSSCTWNVKLAYAVPLAFAAGGNLSLPLVISASVTNWPVVTAMPLSVSVPAAGSVLIFTAKRLLAGVSLRSVKPKSAAVN